MQIPVMNDPGDLFFFGRTVKGLTLRPYRNRDETKVVARDDFARDLAAEGGKLPEGQKWTLLDGARVLAVGGLEPIVGGWAAWAYAGDLTPRQWLFAAWMAQACIDWRCRGGGEVSALAETSAGRRLLRRMGLRQAYDPSLYMKAA